MHDRAISLKKVHIYMIWTTNNAMRLYVYNMYHDHSSGGIVSATTLKSVYITKRSCCSIVLFGCVLLFGAVLRNLKRESEWRQREREREREKVVA